MADLPKSVRINEEGPREGFQFEKGPISTARMCEEMGIETGVNLDALLESARLAENIVGHPLPGSLMKGGTLARLRQQAAA